MPGSRERYPCSPLPKKESDCFLRSNCPSLPRTLLPLTGTAWSLPPKPGGHIPANIQESLNHFPKKTENFVVFYARMRFRSTPQKMASECWIKQNRQGALQLTEPQRSLPVLFIFRSDDSLLRANRTRIFIEN